ncbi:MAG TPA: tRNA preQ1(34) S-adenosylmethionine ribosyltransferase-isomerase QueA [Cyanobacteria bacterium UBA11149]|nr:tRNA preQ1(34) S-adenosylmethionine ribosyltransferase-isomerase QueA [Cyanobacteria bacterium UBA11367]HBE60342.1 tRNA preQ1(34) S-adenosylmethionine ribosyltransferase-isomerase QueA [Cyanobacteria bacterium UBA11366]HBK66646.1 tRNA preQ1(34) S-adenosylmethionine ribosyltransferase-isomerase QueA [Cyanobacteria bacterium UBA11166]HBR75416.1 tRNA preQ1(34) S-adenosylmethionine ribosyltransferase-isomerase QueA [Cyanobacteria bacterium UBA11159]HBS71860.1 tRNA preQ1(34) S-adenosylmethionine 
MDAQSQSSNPVNQLVDLSESTQVSDGLEKQRDMDKFVSSYDYQLPEERIAQTPLIPRDSSRLLVVNSPAHHQDRIFRDLPQLIQPGDLLILNNTRVIPARLYGRKLTGAPVEVLLLEEQKANSWLALVKPGRRLKVGAKILFTPRQFVTSSPFIAEGASQDTLPILTAEIVARDEATNGRILQFDLPSGVSLITLLEQYGEIPFPPYITNSQATGEQYQTVYAKEPGSVAAPTAGLHFTPELLQECRERGIEQASVTLNVGVGTFRPVEVEHVTEHIMHGEWLEVPAATVAKIRKTKASGGRVIAVGTTAVRALEGAAASGELQPYCGKTELFIYPGYQWRVVEGLITNFHLPRSSLLMLVSALIGRERLLALYQDAIARNYRFYSFGDAMLILPEAVR